MTFKKDTQIKAWSFSRYNTYKQCPLKAKLKFIDKIKEPGSAPMQRGAETHDIAKDYLTLPGRRLVPNELVLFSELFKGLRKRSRKISTFMVVEETWAFKKDWTQTVWDDWDDCWVRIKLDSAWLEDDETMIVNDWKTGKFREDDIEDYMEQLELYALAALILHPHVELVKPRLAYLDEGMTYPETPRWTDIVFDRKDIPRLKKLWAKRVEPMLNDTIFAPRANKFCYNCYFKKNNKDEGGGQCKF